MKKQRLNQTMGNWIEITELYFSFKKTDLVSRVCMRFGLVYISQIQIKIKDTDDVKEYEEQIN